MTNKRKEPRPIRVNKKSDIFAPRGPPKLFIRTDEDLLKKAGSVGSYETKVIKIYNNKIMSKVEEIIEQLKSLTLLEAADLVKQIEETFDVSAAAPVGGGMMMMAPGAGGGEEAAEEKTEFDLVLEEVPADKKIAVSLTLPIDYLRRIAPFSTPYGLVLITGNQKALCLTDLEKLWNNQLNKRNLTVHKSKLAQNYARNYKPSKVLLERFHEQQNSSPYISAPNKLKPHKIKEGVSDKH